MRVADSIVEERRGRLTDLLREHAFLSTRQVCEKLGVSAATARRDLASLARGRRAVRTHGGALLEFDAGFPAFRDRLTRAGEAKARIAARARELLQPGMTIFLDAGTTTYALALELTRQSVTPLRVITNSLPAAERLAGAAMEGLEVHLLGGRLLARQSVLLGRDARRALAGHGPLALAFLGAQAMDGRGLWNTRPEVAEFQRLVAARAARCVCLLDASKLGLRTEHFLLPWEAVDVLITDAKPTPLRATGVSLRPDQCLSISI